MFVKWLFGAVRLVVGFLQTTHNYRRQFRVSYISQFRRLLRLYLRDRYTSQEIATLGLADPRIPLGDLQKTISKRALLRIQYSLNGIGYISFTEDKAFFYALCTSFQIPTPSLYAVFSPDEGWLDDGTIIKGQSQWVDYFERLAPRKIAIKPCLGVYGRGFKIVERQARRWRCTSGIFYHSCELYQCLAKDPDFDRFIFQEWVGNHDNFAQVSKTEALQTARIVTLMNRERSPQIIWATFKIAKGDNITDNFEGGKSGNLIARLDISTGRVLAVVGVRNGVLESITHGDYTGVSFLDFTVPLWKEAKELALQAATRFWPIRTIGWDIAITENGPVVIEGNQCWDPSVNLFKQSHILREQLAQETTL